MSVTARTSPNKKRRRIARSCESVFMNESEAAAPFVSWRRDSVHTSDSGMILRIATTSSAGAAEATKHTRQP